MDAAQTGRMDLMIWLCRQLDSMEMSMPALKKQHARGLITDGEYAREMRRYELVNLALREEMLYMADRGQWEEGFYH